MHLNYRVSQIYVYTLWNVISQQRNETEIQFVLCSISQTSLSPYMFKLSTFCHSTLAYLGRPHLVRGQVSECKAFIFWLAKFDEHWIFRYQSHENIASMTSLGLVQKPARLHQHSGYQWNFSFFFTDLSTHLAAFHRLKPISDSCYCYPCLW